LTCSVIGSEFFRKYTALAMSVKYVLYFTTVSKEAS
jgi:hypothetical protein